MEVFGKLELMVGVLEARNMRLLKVRSQRRMDSRVDMMVAMSNEMVPSGEVSKTDEV